MANYSERGLIVTSGFPEAQLVVISGLPGKVATLVAEGVEDARDLWLLPSALSSENHAKPGAFSAIGTRPINLISPAEHRNILEKARRLNGIIVDFTRPDAVNRNAELYTRVGVPFVMGTTGGDRQKLMDTVKGSEISAVIAPNMATPMVVIQAMLEYASKTFPWALDGWELEITESHQSTKKDVSGTAKTWRPLLEALGATMSEDIVSIRDQNIQRNQFGVRDLDAHGYHFITLSSPDERTKIELSTEINGRGVYVGGTLQAIRFLREKIRAGSKGEVFSMIDVLKG